MKQLYKTPLHTVMIGLLVLMSIHANGAQFIVQSNLDLPANTDSTEVSPGVFTVETLRSAIALANNESMFPGADLITFDLPQNNVNQSNSHRGNPNEIVVGLVGDQFNFQTQSSPSAFGIDSAVIIDGNQDSGQSASLVALGLRHFQVNPGGRLRLQNLTLSEGETPLNSSGRGGAVVVDDAGKLEVENSGFLFNNAVNGGAIAIQNGALASSISTTTFLFNVSTDEIPFTENGSGGALFTDNNLALLTLTDNLFLFNQADANGGAIYINGMVEMTQTEVLDNEADLSGGGIFLDTLATVTITNSIIYENNSFLMGGGLAMSGNATAEIISTTVTDNRTNPDNFSSDVNGSQSTQGGGLFAPPTADLLLHNSLVSGNFDQGEAGDVAAAVDPVSSHNLIGVDLAIQNISNGINGNQIGTALQPINAQLQYDSLLRLAGLKPNSPALNTGSNAEVTNYNLTTDYRGPGFPRIQGSDTDIGAFEMDYIFINGFETAK